jgi:Surfeit locus protein 6
MAVEAQESLEVGAYDTVLAAADAYIRNVFRLVPRSVFNPLENTAAKLIPAKASGISSKSKKKLKTTQKRRDPAQSIRRQLADDNPLAEKLDDKICKLRAARKADDAMAVEKRLVRKRKRQEKAGSKSFAEKKRSKTSKASNSEEQESELPSMPNMDHAVSDAVIGGATSGSVTTCLPTDKSVEKLQLPRLVGFADDDDTVDGKPKRNDTKRGKKRSKLDKLSLQLEKAEADRAKADKVASETMQDAAEEFIEDEMEKALMRAKGVSVKDKASKIRKTIRKEKRKKEKSREEWAKRTDLVKGEKEARQQKREERLKERRENKGKQSANKAGKKVNASGSRQTGKHRQG